jgi:hypothetical protein
MYDQAEKSVGKGRTGEKVGEEKRGKLRFPFLRVCYLIPLHCRGADLRRHPDLLEPPVAAKTCNACWQHWVQNRSLRACRQAEIARDHCKTRAIAIRPLCGNMGLCCACQILLLCWALENGSHNESDPRTFGAGRFVIFLFRW